MVLIHGFASNRTVNWINTGWVDVLAKEGYRVLAIDNRGHGRSGHSTDPAHYQTTSMAADALGLLDHLGLKTAAFMGYSMGARIAAFAALAAPNRADALVLSGLADNLVHGVGGSEAIAAAMEAPTASSVDDPVARAFRVFADQTGSHLPSLAACIRAARQTLTEADVASVQTPTLVVAGDKDDIAGSAEALATMMPNATPLVLENRDHMTAVGDKTHKEAVAAFLKRHLFKP